MVLSKNFVELEKDKKYYVEVVAYYKDKKHGDTDNVAKGINDLFEQHYGCMPNPLPAYFFPLDPADPDAAREMAKIMLQLAGTENKGNNCS